MNQHITHQDLTKRLVEIKPTGAPCPVCFKGELLEGGTAYGCDTCGKTFTETALFRIVNAILGGASDATVDHLHEMTDMCLTEPAHIRSATDDQRTPAQRYADEDAADLLATQASAL